MIDVSALVTSGAIPQSTITIRTFATPSSIDGFGRTPRQFSDVTLQFSFYPANSSPTILVDGQRIKGLRHVVPRMVVATDIGGGFYSNPISFDIIWFGAIEVNVIAYSDRNGNGFFDGEPCYRVVMQDRTVTTETTTWGSIKQR